MNYGTDKTQTQNTLIPKGKFNRYDHPGMFFDQEPRRSEFDSHHYHIVEKISTVKNLLKAHELFRKSRFYVMTVSRTNQRVVCQRSSYKSSSDIDGGCQG